jgi:hypothetical protein
MVMRVPSRGKPRPAIKRGKCCDLEASPGIEPGQADCSPVELQSRQLFGSKTDLLDIAVDQSPGGSLQTG